jgi:UDP-N-acetylmuramoyl-tripeptide--D-alanyl-D-alanine ligase
MLKFQHGVFFIFVSKQGSMTAIEKIYGLYHKSAGISTDSRSIIRESIFFAIKGDQFNGNQFAGAALDNGASYAVVDDPSVIDGDRYILVDDTLKSLQQLAILHRGNVKAKIIGITGSNGKTTTKELIGRVLDSTHKTLMTQGNLNNHIGVPLTILNIKEETLFAVIEMGANHPGEIGELCRIAQPDYGLITNIGKAHLEGFGSFEGVIKAKSELYDFIREHDGLVFINLDNQLLCRLSAGIKLITYGSGDLAACQGKIIGRDPYLNISWSAGHLSGRIPTHLYGDYNFENILAAVCIGLYFRIRPEEIENAITAYIPDNNRSQWVRASRNILVLDAYNANPSSMKAALNNFHQIDAPSKMIILGDMMELGIQSPEEHRQILSLVRNLSFTKVFLIGQLFTQAARGGEETCFGSITEALGWFRENPVENMTILLKGSRKMQLESLNNLF